MRTAFLALSFLLITSSLVDAAEIHCESLVSPALSYQLVFSEDRLAAKLLIKKLGNEDRREFDCKLVPETGTRIPDAMLTTITCKEKNPRNGNGLSIIFGEGGFIYHREAKIREEVTVGGRVVLKVLEQGHLFCNKN